MNTYRFVYEFRRSRCICSPRKPHQCELNTGAELIQAESNFEAFRQFNTLVRKFHKDLKMDVCRLVEVKEVGKFENYEVVK